MNRMKYAILLCLVLAGMVFLAVPAFAADKTAADQKESTDQGDQKEEPSINDVYWKFDEQTGTLTIGPDGEDGMVRQETRIEKKKDESDAPGTCAPGWTTENYSSIRRVVITGKIHPISTYAWFYTCTQLTEITGLENIDTSETVSMIRMFANCRKLQRLDLSTFDFSSLQYAREMFRGCEGLRQLDLGGFTGTQVRSAQGMFLQCTSLSTLDLSGFAPADSCNLRWMCSGCSRLYDVDLSGMAADPAAAGVALAADGMFQSCKALVTIYTAHGADWSKALKFSADMFGSCPVLTGEKGSKPGSTDGSHARVDGGSAAAGYFTPKHTWRSNKDGSGQVCAVCGRQRTETAGVHQHDGIRFEAWSDASALPTASGNYYLLHDVVIKPDSRGIGSWSITKDRNISLCLNGHSITFAAGAKDPYSIICTGTLSLYDDAGTGVIKTLDTSKRGLLRVSGTLNLYGGKLTGMTSTNNGAPVWTVGTTNVYGGEITGNRTNGKAGGIYVQKGDLKLYGGQITGNASSGSGVYVESAGTVYLQGGGSVRVTGNAGGGKTKNLLLCEGALVRVDDTAGAGSASVGISCQKSPAAGSPVCIAAGDGCRNAIGAFTSDDRAYCIAYTGRQLSLKLNDGRCTVAFDSDGGTAVDSQELQRGGIARKPADPTKDDREFAGWQLNGKTYDFTQPVTEDIVLTAVWKHSGANLSQVKAKEATCTEDGNRAYWKCNVCGKLYADSAGQKETSLEAVKVEALGHAQGTPEKENVIEATCTETGSYEEVVKCTRCGLELSRSKKLVEPEGHDWSEWEKKDDPVAFTSQADDASGDVYVRTCSQCHEEKQMNTPGTGCWHEHLYTIEKIQPTCTEIGLEKSAFCEDCGEWLRFDAQGNKLVIATDEDVEQIIIPETGHDWRFTGFQWSTVKGEQDVYDVFAAYRCQNAGCEEKLLVDVDEETSYDMGLTSCELGGSLQLTAHIDAVDSPDGQAHEGTSDNHGIFTMDIAPGSHTWSRWITTCEATDVDYGEEARICWECGAIEYRDIPPGGKPAARAIAKLKAGKKSFTVKWKKASKAQRKTMTGYEVSYSTVRSFAAGKTKVKKVKRPAAVQAKVKKLKKGKTYYVRVRAYRVYDGVTYYSSWSKVRKVKTKK